MNKNANISKTSVTLKDIAKLCGVSIATVSMIVNGKDDRISKETRSNVLSIIKEYNYVPNRIASSLVTKTTKSIGLILPDISNPFFPGVARGVEDYANENGWSVILCNSDNSEKKEDMYLDMLQEKKVDGIILSAASERSESSATTENISVPIVSVDRENKFIPSEGNVVIDNIQGSYEAVTHMLERGYTKIIHLSGQMNLHTAKERYEGYMKAHREFDIEPTSNHLYEGEYTSEYGERIVNQLIQSGITFDGLFCGNDLIALGALKVLKANQISVPDQVGIVGFDDVYLSQLVTPELSTVHQPIYELGYKSAELLIKISMSKETKQKEVRKLLQSSLVVRGTTK